MIVRGYACPTMVEEASVCLGYEGPPTRLETKMASTILHRLSASYTQGKQQLLRLCCTGLNCRNHFKAARTYVGMHAHVITQSSD